MPPQDLPLSARSQSVRDERLDFWRGLCLIDMVLVHLVHQGMNFGQPWWSILGEYTRFAAGGFIFVAGMSVGAIFLPRVREERNRRKTHLRLMKRSGYILAVHYIATAGFLLLYPLYGSGPFASVSDLLRDILLFRSGSDLLPFYVVMVAITPLLLELLRRGMGWLVALLSLAVFMTWGRMDPYFLSAPIQQCFLLPLWQVIFIAGLLAGAALPAYDRLAQSTKRIIAGFSTIFLVVMFFGAYGGDFGLALSLPVVFWKVPLSVGEILKYLAFMLALMSVTDLFWQRLAGSAVVRFSSRMGRRSLAMYVVHVWIVSLTVTLAGWLGWSGASNLIFAITAVAALWGTAWVMDFCKTCMANVHGREGRQIEMASLGGFSWWRPAFNMPAIGAATVAMLFLVNAIVRNPVQEIPVVATAIQLPDILPGEEADEPADEAETPDSAFPSLVDHPEMFPEPVPTVSILPDDIPA